MGYQTNLGLLLCWHRDAECHNTWHQVFLSAMMGMWTDTTIFIPGEGDVEVPVGGMIIFSGSKAHAECEHTAIVKHDVLSRGEHQLENAILLNMQS